MSRRRPKWTESEQLSVELACRCGRRLDRATLQGEGVSAMQVTFLYDDVDRPGSRRPQAMSRLKGKPDATAVERYMTPTGHAPLVRTLRCKTCGARCELSEDPLVKHLTTAWQEGRRGHLPPVVIS